ncbi:hypothetical protein A167_00781 [Alcanivorax sp. S71-1-4]|jgi:hypothetical protein|uniref:hypothetical protein n=1 Tax=Alcanivorax sp. S71-1-4 TaxID=1177159 RepID=UPI00135859BC|nr:hypothetical protein [Alcanivorax sp. S71-1-4]KAF0810501.1 hypothetical protein A167_00781 [Alcanivorax sp. S71-1-4]
MSVRVQVVDESPSGAVIAQNIFIFPSRAISVRELIRTRVIQEVQKQNEDADSGDARPNLVRPEGGNAQQRVVDTESQCSIALEAFSSNGFFLFVNEEQMTSLDQTILVTPNTHVSFVRLVTLVGG